MTAPRITTLATCSPAAWAAAGPVILLVQDTTTMEFSAHRSTTGLGPIRSGSGQGFQLQTVLAVQPEPRLPLGIMAATPWIRQPAPDHPESCNQRRRRPRESAIWSRMVQTVGTPPDGTRWVHVADRGADSFAFLRVCDQQGVDVLIRAAQDRIVTDAAGVRSPLFAVVAACPERGQRPLRIPNWTATASTDCPVATRATASRLNTSE